MFTGHRLVVVGVVTALVTSVAACGHSDEVPSTGDLSSTPFSDGVTTISEVFGRACGQLPQGNTAGSLTSMGPQPVATAVSTNPLLSTLATALKTAGLTETLNSEKAITVFAPSNDAFAATAKTMGPQRFTALIHNKDALSKVLTYHIIAKRYDRTGLVNADTVSPVAGGSLRIHDNGTTITDGAGTTATVLCGNIPTSNATVFVINKVLTASKS